MPGAFRRGKKDGCGAGQMRFARPRYKPTPIGVGYGLSDGTKWSPSSISLRDKTADGPHTRCRVTTTASLPRSDGCVVAQVRH